MKNECKVFENDVTESVHYANASSEVAMDEDIISFAIIKIHFNAFLAGN